MSEQGAYGSQLGQAFRQNDPPVLVTRSLHKSTIAVTELRCDQRNFGRTGSLSHEDAYLIGLQLRACPDHDLYFDGRLTRPINWSAGATTIFDLRRDPIADIRDPFHCLIFYLSRQAIADLAREEGVAATGELRYENAVGLNDPVVYHLLSALTPAFAHPDQAHPLFLDHVVLALTSHMAVRYGGVIPRSKRARRGLAPWQERRAKEMMAAQLREEVPLSRLAEECGLSVRHFARAFRESTGMPPHRWLLCQRVDRAKALLRGGKASLAEIALSSGFVDQSHLTRTFKAQTGITPGVWRRHATSPSAAYQSAQASV